MIQGRWFAAHSEDGIKELLGAYASTTAANLFVQLEVQVVVQLFYRTSDT
jgi:hypothetical protein